MVVVGQAVTLEEVAEPARTAAQTVLDREWYTPGTLKALGGGKMGPPPFLALVFDDAKEEVMWFGQSAEGFGKRNKYCWRLFAAPCWLYSWLYSRPTAGPFLARQSTRYIYR